MSMNTCIMIKLTNGSTSMLCETVERFVQAPTEILLCFSIFCIYTRDEYEWLMHVLEE